MQLKPTATCTKTCLPKHGGGRDNKFFGQLSEVDQSLQTLLKFRDRTPRALTTGTSSSIFLHTYHSRFIRYLRCFTYYQNYLVMRNTANVTGDKPVAAWSQSITGVSVINPLVVFYGIHGRKREVLIFYFVPDTTTTLHILSMRFAKCDFWASTFLLLLSAFLGSRRSYAVWIFVFCGLRDGIDNR
jgi:hypothetical protein